MSYSNRYTPPPTESTQSTLAWESEIGPMNSASQVTDDKKKLTPVLTSPREVYSKTHHNCMLNLASNPDYDLTVTYKGNNGAIQFLPVVIYLEAAMKKLQKQQLDQGISVNHSLLRQHTGDLHCPSRIALPVSIVGDLTSERQMKFINCLYPVLERLIVRRLRETFNETYELRDLTFEFVRHQPADHTMDPEHYNRSTAAQLIQGFIDSEVVFTDMLTDVITVAGLLYHLKMVWEKERALSHGDTGELWRDPCLSKTLKRVIIEIASVNRCTEVNIKHRLNGVKDYHGATETLGQACFVGLKFKREPKNEIANMPMLSELLLCELRNNIKLKEVKALGATKKNAREILDAALTPAQKKRIKCGV